MKFKFVPLSDALINGLILLYNKCGFNVAVDVHAVRQRTAREVHGSEGDQRRRDSSKRVDQFSDHQPLPQERKYKRDRSAPIRRRSLRTCVPLYSLNIRNSESLSSKHFLQANRFEFLCAEVIAKRPHLRLCNSVLYNSVHCNSVH